MRILRNICLNLVAFWSGGVVVLATDIYAQTEEAIPIDLWLPIASWPWYLIKFLIG
jgi:hypothetical protein